MIPGRSLLLIALVVGLSLGGDWLIKHASARHGGPLSLPFALGALLYALSAFCWFYLMRGHSLAAIGVLYAAGTLLGLAAVGALAFGEAVGPRQALGLTLAVAAVVVVGR